MMGLKRRWIECGSLALMTLLLAACGEQELYAQLSQRQANDMTAVLRSSGIEADKKQRDGGTFAVLVPRESFSPAMDVLRAHGLPREGYDSLGQVFKKEGFGSSPLEDRARLNHALSQEMANTLSSIDGVITARVHLSLPERDPLADKPLPSSASVFIKHRAGVDLNARVGNIKSLVVNALPSLSYENVTVALFQAEPLPVRATPSNTGALGGLGGLGTALSAALGVGMLALLVGGGLWWWQRRPPPATADAQPGADDGEAAPGKRWALITSARREVNGP
jgi:type III secretion protein J